MKTKASSVNQVKDHNTGLILNALKTVPYGTKNTVSQITGLSIATCNTILNELAQTAKVIEIQGDSTTAGRPPKSYQFNADYYHVCCMFFTHEDFKRSIHYSIVNLLGGELEHDELEKDFIGCDTIMQVIEDLIIKDPRIRKISTGIQGYVQDGLIVSSGIEQLENKPLKQILTDRFGIEVHCNNDMNIIALGLFRKMFPHTADPFAVIGLFKGRRPGAGAIVHERIVKGMSNFAGEVLNLDTTSLDFWSDIDKHYPEAVEKTFLVVLSYIAIINPKTIVLTGINASGKMADEVRKLCTKRIPQQHIPELLYIEDINPYYIDGLFQKTIASDI